VLRQNMYFYNIRTNTSTRITPTSFGPQGSLNFVYAIEWLKGSTDTKDSLLLGNMVFVPQEDALYPSKHAGPLLQSPKLDLGIFRDVLYSIFDSASGEVDLLLNEQFIPQSRFIMSRSNISWSPSGEQLAFSVIHRLPGTDPEDPATYEEVWIMNVKKFKAKPNDPSVFYRLNFQELFCTYSFWGVQAEFITDSSLAVSMHKDGSDFSGLWEVTTRGTIVRQLTSQ